MFLLCIFLIKSLTQGVQHRSIQSLTFLVCVSCRSQSMQRMLGTFPKAFSQAAISQMCKFQCGNFPNLSQLQCLAPILFQSQRSNQQLITVAALASHFSLQRLRRPNVTFGMFPFGKLHNWGSSQLGNCNLGSRPWENSPLPTPSECIVL